MIHSNAGGKQKIFGREIRQTESWFRGGWVKLICTKTEYLWVQGEGIDGDGRCKIAKNENLYISGIIYKRE